MGGTKWWLVGAAGVVAIAGLTWLLMSGGADTTRHGTASVSDTDTDRPQRPMMRPTKLPKDAGQRLRRAPRRDEVKPVKEE